VRGQALRGAEIYPALAGNLFVDVTAVDMRVPKVLNFTEISHFLQYPRLAQLQGVEGNVVIRALVGSDGCIRDYKIVRQSAAIFVEAVKNALPLLQFRPASYQNQPINAWIVLPFEFKMEI
jgi:TonB family protein